MTSPRRTIRATSCIKCMTASVFAIVMCCTLTTWAQQSPDGLWKPVSPQEVAAAQAEAAATDDRAPRFRPNNFRTFNLAEDALRGILRRIPKETNERKNLAVERPAELTLPFPDGTFQRFRIIESPILSPALAAKFPEIRAFRGEGVDDPTATARIDLSPAGLRAQVTSAQGVVIIDPLTTGADGRYLSFAKRNNRAQSPPFECRVLPRAADAARAADVAHPPSGSQVRTYRLAVACTGEYAAHFGGTVAGALAAIHTTVNRVTEIYEREASIRFELVGDNDELIFLKAATDPFNNDDADILIGQSQVVIDKLIGDPNYDIGHTLSTGAGGLAGLGVVCRSGQKARGVTGRSAPVGDPFDVDYVAHEIGHQFDGDHCFNGLSGSCGGGNRNAATAVEPGSGSTIQAYAGICQGDNLQLNSDTYFHSVSLDQIIAYSTVGAGNRPMPVATGNTPPMINGGLDLVVPKETAFKLVANGSDADGHPLTFCWEERDLGPAAAINAADDGAIPLFRSFQPATSPSRVFPQWSDILSNAATRGEKLPLQARVMKFRVTARDGRGGVSGDDVTVRVHPEAGPFRVIAPTSTTQTAPLFVVKWDVAGSAAAPISALNVNILLSTDGGQSFPHTLAAATPNDGQELVAAPAGAESNLRVLVESADGTFFAVSPTNFQIKPHRARIFLVRHAERTAGDDLTPQGLVRADALAQLLRGARLSAVYSTDTQRTRKTAQPSATGAAVNLTIYNNSVELAESLQTLDQGKQVLVVSHSGEVEVILKTLGTSFSGTIEGEFDNLFVIGLTNDQPDLTHLKYQPPAATVVVGPEHAASVRASAMPVETPSSRQSAAASRGPRSVEAVAASAALGRFADSGLPVVHLAQNWTAKEALEFYNLRQGSPLMNRDLFNALEQPRGTGLFRESAYLAQYGFLPQRQHAMNPHGYPIGFVAGDAVELNCSACHTSRITHAGKEYRIDGSQAMIDAESLLRDLALALQQTVDSGPTRQELEAMSPLARYDLDPQTKFGRFAKRILGIDNPRVSRVYGLVSMLERDYDRRQRYNDYNDFGRRLGTPAERESATRHVPYGPGRLDALGAILNQACAEAMQRDGNAAIANAPVNFPAIWDAPQHTHVQWNGAVDNTAFFGPLGRNAGQVVGVFGLVELNGDTLVGYDSSVNFEALERAEQLVTKLWSPLWPDDFGIDTAVVARGKEVYERNCLDCHAFIDRDNPAREAGDVLIAIDRAVGRYPALATDSLTAKNWNDRTATLDFLAGRYITRPLGARFSSDAAARVPSREVLTHVVFGAIARSFVPWREELTLDSAAPRNMLASATVDQTLMRYKARPLNGVWSTAPYLHNGSVLNMVELLMPPAGRKRSFRVGTTDYEPATLGFKDDGPFTFDTTKPGNSNLGHVYGTELPPADKLALIEFLKSF